VDVYWDTVYICVIVHPKANWIGLPYSPILPLPVTTVYMSVCICRACCLLK